MQDLMRFTRPPTRMCHNQLESQGGAKMEEKSRGVTLTIFAILLALMAISNFGKPFSHNPGVGFVFFGTRLSGAPNMIVAPIFGIVLAVYVYGILAMRKFALPIGIFYAAYVIVNMPLFLVKYQGTAVMQEHSWAYLLPYPFVAIGVSSGAAWLLYRRKADMR
jgi:hypothetical protein